jgi:hypothetical protein
MDFSRRNFLRGLVAVPILVGMPKLLVARPSLPREPFVRARDSVNYIGLALHPAPTFQGGRIVMEILPWNGQFYPVVLNNGYYGKHSGTEVFPDHDLSAFRTELPPDFWLTRTVDEWPNVHAWVRHHRYGEHPDVMRARSDAVRRGLPWPAAFS